MTVVLTLCVIIPRDHTSATALLDILGTEEFARVSYCMLLYVSISQSIRQTISQSINHFCYFFKPIRLGALLLMG